MQLHVQSVTQPVTGTWAFARYEAVRPRLPVAAFPAHFARLGNLGALMDEFDAFVFDSFGVLNVGETPIPDARNRIEKLRANGKQVFVLTNGATVPLADLEKKYRTLGFEFASREIVSSREVLANTLARADGGMMWGVAAPQYANIEELPVRCYTLHDTPEAFANCDGFILLSSQNWNGQMQARLGDAHAARTRPLLVGNPDLVAPREDGFSMEPGAYAHALADSLAIEPVFYGKPFANAFDEVAIRLGSDIESRRIAMVGDTLHTDILGGAAAGWRTILVTQHGVMKELDVEAAIKSSGIIPDYIVPQI